MTSVKIQLSKSFLIKLWILNKKVHTTQFTGL